MQLFQEASVWHIHWSSLTNPHFGAALMWWMNVVRFGATDLHYLLVILVEDSLQSILEELDEVVQIRGFEEGGVLEIMHFYPKLLEAITTMEHVIGNGQ